MGGAVVTGAGRGLGLEIARRLAARGLARAIVIRIADLFPGLSNRLLPLILADARRQQRRRQKRIESGRAP
jgi:NAD(P)-dependent dehydrogenase (short-subunit alcohol dehydrogenase family)